jgi:hypothetical protein
LRALATDWASSSVASSVRSKLFRPVAIFLLIHAVVCSRYRFSGLRSVAGA